MRWHYLFYSLLLAVPAAFVLHWQNASPVPMFIVSAAGIIPLAALMGRATEALAERLGSTAGGLLNATFGNAAELIIGLVALHKGMVTVVKASITGSIIGNALLTLGVSLLVGGLRYRRQSFNRVQAGLQANLLVLATVGLLIPSLLVNAISNESELHLSEEVAVVLLATYVLSVIFSLLRPDPESEPLAGPVHKHEFSWRGTGFELGMLAGTTALVAILSEYLVGAIEVAQQNGYLARWGMSEVFVGVILVAVMGNVAEHSSAVVMAYRNKVDITLHIAIGSSLQIALLVTPVLVFAGLWIAPKPMDLHFTTLELVAVAASVIVVALVAADGESHWMEGVLLLAVYAILALAFYHVPDPTH